MNEASVDDAGMWGGMFSMIDAVDSKEQALRSKLQELQDRHRQVSSVPLEPQVTDEELAAMNKAQRIAIRRHGVKRIAEICRAATSEHRNPSRAERPAPDQPAMGAGIKHNPPIIRQCQQLPGTSEAAMDDNWDVPYQNLDLEFELETVHEMCMHEWVDDNGAGMLPADEHVDVWVDDSAELRCRLPASTSMCGWSGLARGAGRVRPGTVLGSSP